MPRCCTVFEATPLESRVCGRELPAGSMPGGGWQRKRLSAARARQELVECGLLEQVRPAVKGLWPAIYRFGVVRIDRQ